MSVAAAIADGTREDVLKALRDIVAEALDADPAARDISALSKQLLDIDERLAAISAPKEGSAASDIAARRAASRRPSPANRRRPAG